MTRAGSIMESGRSTQPTMNAYYINLESATDRRASVEGTFAKYASMTWQLIRVPAIDADEIRNRKIPGTIKDTQKACLLSHQKAIEQSLGDDGHALFLEDDASIGPRGFKVLGNLDISNRIGVDMLFTSCLIANQDLLLKQYLLYRSLIEKPRTTLIDMKQLEFAGTDGYILRKEAKEKLLDLFKATSSFDQPYDLLLKNWIRKGMLTAAVTFPFLTTLSNLGDQPQIDAPNADWNAFRRLFCIDSRFFVEEEPGVTVDMSESRINAFTDEYLRLLKILLIRYTTY